MFRRRIPNPFISARSKGVPVCEIILYKKDANTQTDDDGSEDIKDINVKMEICDTQNDSCDNPNNIVKIEDCDIQEDSRDNMNNCAEIEIPNMTTESAQDEEVLTQGAEEEIEFTYEMTDDASTEDDYESCTSTEEDKRSLANEDTSAHQEPSTSQEIEHCVLHCKCNPGAGSKRGPKIFIDPDVRLLRTKLLLSKVQEKVFDEMEIYELSRKQREDQIKMIDEVMKELNQRKSQLNCNACDICLFYAFLYGEI